MPQKVYFERPDRLRIDSAQLLIVDVQARLLPHISEHELVSTQCVRAIQCAGVLGLPITFFEQYPAKLGHTATPLLEAHADKPTVLEKITFSAGQDEAGWRHVYALGRPQILIAGIESHVCVQQTALDLKARGSRVWILADAVGSRRKLDHETAIRRMENSGILVTTVEAAVYELMHRADTELFRRMLPLIK